jgi:DNA-binding response OmpR family regulator
MKANILWIEGKRADGPSFLPALRKKGYQVEIVPTGKAALSSLNEVDPDVVVVNAASLRTNGVRICQAIVNEREDLPVLLIANPDSPEPKGTCAHVVLNLPFTIRKLVNRLKPYIPTTRNNLLHAGPIELDMEHKWVRCGDKEARLTPRIASLLKILMRHPGVVIERERLFREAWNTEYTGDTRTLDVHISWLRRAIEDDPRHPRYLKTIRGVGYRLDV